MSMGASNTELGVGDAVPMVREVTSGGNGNALLKYLHGQGYHVDLYYPDPRYFMFKQGQHADAFNMTNARSLFAYAMARTHFTFLCTNRFCDYEALSNLHDRLFGKPIEERYSIRHHVSDHIRRTSSRPSLTVVFGGALHSPPSSSWRPDRQWKDTGQYQRKVVQSNVEIESVCRDIVRHDPDAVIVLLGDHGPHNYRGVAGRAPLGDAEALLENIERSGVPYEEVVRDMFDVFLAVRMPHGRPLLTGGREIVSCNVFRHVFATINDDPSILDGCPENWAEINGVRVVRNGRIVPPEELARQ